MLKVPDGEIESQVLFPLPFVLALAVKIIVVEAPTVSVWVELPFTGTVKVRDELLNVRPAVPPEPTVKLIGAVKVWLPTVTLRVPV